MENELVDTLQEFVVKVKADLQTNVPSSMETNPNFNRSTFWLDFCISSQKTARAASKITIYYSKPALPNAAFTRPLIAELIVNYNALVNCFQTLPKDQGEHLNKAVSATLKSIQASLLQFVISFIIALRETRPMNLTGEMGSIGILLRECDQVVNLPKNNKDAVVKVMETVHSLMSDTVDEVTEELKNQINLKRSGRQGVVLQDSEVWSDTEYEIISYTLKLSKLGRVATGNCHGYLSNETRSASISVLDEMANTALTLSPCLDDFVSSVYPPIEDTSLPELLEKFSTSLKDFVNAFDKCPELNEAEKEVTSNIRKQLKKITEKLKTLLISNEILGIAHLSIHQQ